MIGSAKHYNKRQIIQLPFCTLCRTVISVERYEQGCTKTCSWSPRWLTFPTMTPDICGSSVRNFLHIKILAPRTFKRLLHFWEILCTPEYSHLKRVKDTTAQTRLNVMLCFPILLHSEPLQASLAKYTEFHKTRKGTDRVGNGCGDLVHLAWRYSE
jgi:hypothetical protein